MEVAPLIPEPAEPSTARILIEDAAVAADVFDGRYLVISNIAKKPNVVQLIHSAAAFGFEAILVGSVKIRDTMQSSLHLPPAVTVRWFPSLKETKEFLLQRGCLLVGIEILAEASPCTEFEFPSRVAIMPGNEGDGMSAKQMQLCDAFVYIPQYGTATASLNVHVATTLIMHHCRLFQSRTS